jgi:AraC-like DNA-binding protein
MRVPFMDIRADYMDTRQRRVLDLRPHGASEIPLLGWCAYSHARPDLPEHRHLGVMEITYVERGCQIFQVADQTYRIRGGEAFITFPDEPHSSGGHPVEPGLLYWLNLRLPLSGRGMLGLSQIEGAQLAKALRGLPRRHFRAGGRLKPLFDRLLELHDRPEIALRTIRLRKTLVDLLLEVLDRADQQANSETSQRMVRVISAIESHLHEDLRLEDLALQVGLSLSRFKAFFKKEIGIPPRQFILRKKIEAAQKRLVGGREPIGRIAIDLGFPSSQYFATVFKRIVGITPQTCRDGEAEPPMPSRRHSDGQW